MKLDTLDALNDDELRSAIARSQELLKTRDEERKAKATAEARALLASVGLNFKDVVAGGKGAKSAKPPVYRGGMHYQHPAKKELTWNAKGQKPNWLRELEAQGGKAVEVPA
jgi:DNA-binding protein H-NS